MTKGIAVISLVATLWMTACSDDTEQPKDDGGLVDQSPGDVSQGKDQTQGADLAVLDAASGDPRVLLKTSMGDITLELNQAKAPITVKNFMAYVDAKAYDGTLFHRVISTFMIQGGGFDSSFTKKQTNPPIKNEADNGLSNVRGSIAMARTPVVDSATNQFFINVMDNAGLDHKDKTSSGYGYAVFGKVVVGIDVVDKIKAVPTGAKGPFSKNCPTTDVVIQSAARSQ